MHIDHRGSSSWRGRRDERRPGLVGSKEVGVGGGGAAVAHGQGEAAGDGIECASREAGDEVRIALVEELRVIGAGPHHRGVPDPGGTRYHEAVFGGAGVVSYLVDDASKILPVYVITGAD
ncbi:hypothetical protein ACWDR1_32105 [Streptosporangium sandarakinum]